MDGASTTVLYSHHSQKALTKNFYWFPKSPMFNEFNGALWHNLAQFNSIWDPVHYWAQCGLVWHFIDAAYFNPITKASPPVQFGTIELNLIQFGTIVHYIQKFVLQNWFSCAILISVAPFGWGSSIYVILGWALDKITKYNWKWYNTNPNSLWLLWKLLNCGLFCLAFVDIFLPNPRWVQKLSLIIVS
jgi:hypothetical protein